MTNVWKLRVRTAELRDDVLVTLPEGATVGQLASAVGVSPDLVTIDGSDVSAHRAVSGTGAKNGSVIGQRVPDDEQPRQAEAGLMTLDQIAGLSGVGSTPLGQGRYDFTPASGSPTTDYRVSDINFTLDVDRTGSATVVPRGRPVVVDDVLIQQPRQLGDDVLHVGSARFRAHRTSQVAPPARPDHGLAVDAQPASRRMQVPALPPRTARPLSYAWLALAPLAVGFGVLGLLVHDLFYLAAIPTLGLAIWYVYSHIRSERRAQAAHHIETERVVHEFEGRVRAERRHLAGSLRDAQPSIPDLVRVLNDADAESDNGADPRTAAHWDRGVGDELFGQVSLGLGDLSWRIQTQVADPAPVVQTIIRRNGTLPSVPIVTDLAEGTIGIAGDRSSALSCVRAIVASLATHSPPDSVRIALCAEADRLADWDWMKWLPHSQVGPSLATTAIEADRLVSSWRTPGHDWLQLVVVDQADWARDDRSLLCTVGREPGKQVLIVLEDHLHRLPDCATTVDLASDGTATVRIGTVTHRFVTPVGASVEMTETIACALAGLDSRLMEGPEDAEVATQHFVLARTKPGSPWRTTADQQTESAGVDELVPPPIPASAKQPTLDLTIDRSADSDTPAPERHSSKVPAEGDPSSPIDLRDRVDALADAVETPNDEGFDPFT